MNLLILSDIHGNFPALMAIERFFEGKHFDCLVNLGDSTVYGPFPNETLEWLQVNKVCSILGNTDKKVIKLLCGKTFNKPKKDEKRVMYTWTATTLEEDNRRYLLTRKKILRLDLSQQDQGIDRALHLFHGSPADPDEFLFDHTPTKRFQELATGFHNDLILIGHSHTPFHTTVGTTHFINPGSVGRMFDGNPDASCATLRLTPDTLEVTHYRIPYPVEQVVTELRKYNLPLIYEAMFLQGRKLKIR